MKTPNRTSWALRAPTQRNGVLGQGRTFMGGLRTLLHGSYLRSLSNVWSVYLPAGWQDHAKPLRYGVTQPDPVTLRMRSQVFTYSNALCNFPNNGLSESPKLINSSGEWFRHRGKLCRGNISRSSRIQHARTPISFDPDLGTRAYATVVKVGCPQCARSHRLR